MRGSDEWAFADGSLPGDTGTYNGLFPDMRGVFIRGVNVGRADGNEDPDADNRTGGDLNKAGSYQGDAFQGHNMKLSTAPDSAASGSNIGIGTANRTNTVGTLMDTSYTFVTELFNDGTNGDPRTSSETRPSNIAVYWYIKVQ